MSYNYRTEVDSPNFTPARQARAVFGYDRVIEGITIHHFGDPALRPTAAGVAAYLSRPGGNTSAHYVATGDNRTVYCIVAPGDVAWHSGSAWGNARTIGIELDPRARNEDYDVAAELVADIRSAFGDVPVYWHSYFTATACPGAWDADRLDKLSYTKYSHATDWGRGGNISPKAPTPPPQPAPQPEPAKPELYRLLDRNGKQVAAYSKEANAYAGYVQYGKVGIVMYAGQNVTAELISKFTEPSPTTKDPVSGETQSDSGVPVAEKVDYSEANNSLLKQILALVQSIADKLTSIFK